ncbi:MAG: anaerobic ribonucleoside-triphosphate reductase activating protein [Nanoarchaeota archaeon]|nr:anaerobic ribonucleoside-triphosphate reductase activating protein [Nanoarchaeota archaeon]
MVIIKGLQKTSLIDFSPYTVSVIFVGGCDFRCGFCHNPDLVLRFNEIKTIKEEELFKHLDERKKWLDGVCITGGEPCIYKDLPEFIKKIKDRGLLVKLDTNGNNPDILRRIINEKIVDYIAMDVKTSLGDYEKVVNVKVDINRIKESIDLIRNSGIDYEFRTTVVPGLVGKKEVMEIAELLKGSKRYVLQNFRSSRDMIDNKFKGTEIYKKVELEDMKESIKGCFEEVLVRG